MTWGAALYAGLALLSILEPMWESCGLGEHIEVIGVSSGDALIIRRRQRRTLLLIPGRDCATWMNRSRSCRHWRSTMPTHDGVLVLSLDNIQARRAYISIRRGR